MRSCELSFIEADAENESYPAARSNALFATRLGAKQMSAPLSGKETARWAMTNVSISGDLIHHVRWRYPIAVADLANGTVLRTSRNGFSEKALATYVVSVASLEAFVNEVFFCGMIRATLSGSALWQLGTDLVERRFRRLDLVQRIALVGQLMFGTRVLLDRPPMQDLRLLIDARNAVVHYNYLTSPPKFVRPLEERGIALNGRLPDQPNGPSFNPWGSQISTVEGIRRA